MDGSKDNPYSFVLNEDIEVWASFQQIAGNESNMANVVKIYPNPAEDKLYISSECRILHGELRNAQGSVLLQFDDVTETMLPIERIPSGVYFLLCQTEQGTRVYKVIKQ